MSNLGPLVPFVLVIAVFWLLILRPQQRRQRELRALQSSLTPGSDVLLSSGIFGTVSSTTDEHVLVDIAPGVTVKVARGAIAQVITKPELDTPGDTGIVGSEEN